MTPTTNEQDYINGYQYAIKIPKYLSNQELQQYPEKWKHGYKDGKDKLIADAYKEFNLDNTNREFYLTQEELRFADGLDPTT